MARSRLARVSVAVILRSGTWSGLCAGYAPRVFSRGRVSARFGAPFGRASLAGGAFVSRCAALGAGMLDAGAVAVRRLYHRFFGCQVKSDERGSGVAIKKMLRRSSFPLDVPTLWTYLEFVAGRWQRGVNGTQQRADRPEKG